MVSSLPPDGQALKIKAQILTALSSKEKRLGAKSTLELNQGYACCSSSCFCKVGFLLLFFAIIPRDLLLRVTNIC